MSRHATCIECGNDFITPSDTGRVPLRCSTCQPSTDSRYRVRVLELEQQVADLETKLQRAGHRPVDGILGREDLVAAIRRVGQASGPQATATELYHLADVANSWADRICADLEAAA